MTSKLMSQISSSKLLPFSLFKSCS